jgi:hypothetical protein
MTKPSVAKINDLSNVFPGHWSVRLLDELPGQMFALEVEEVLSCRCQIKQEYRNMHASEPAQGCIIETADRKVLISKLFHLSHSG